MIRCFDESCPSRNLYSIAAGCRFIDFHGFPKISLDFMDFHGFRGSKVKKPVAAFAVEVLLLGKPFLDPSCLIFSLIFMGFRGFHKIPWISTHFRGPVKKPVATFAVKVLPLKKPLCTRSQLCAISLIFMDFRGFHEI